LDLDNRILVDENFKRRHAQCLSRTVLIRTILCLSFSPINLRSMVSRKSGISRRN